MKLRDRITFSARVPGVMTNENNSGIWDKHVDASSWFHGYGLHCYRSTTFSTHPPSQRSTARPWKDISGVVGLHHAVLQTGFDEERSPVKIPHTDKQMQERQIDTGLYPRL